MTHAHHINVVGFGVGGSAEGEISEPENPKRKNGPISEPWLEKPVKEKTRQERGAEGDRP